MDGVDLVVTDLDGTFWPTQDAVHPDAARALAEVLSRDVPLLVATGRRVTSTRLPLMRLGAAPPAVVLNGALGLDLDTRERFHRAPFDPVEAEKVLGVFRSVDLDPCIYVDDHRAEVLLSATPSTHPGHVESLGATAAVVDLASAIFETTALGFGIIGADHDALVAAVEALAGLAEVHLDRAFDYPGSAMTVAPLGQSKWDGVVAYCSTRDLDPSRVLALADGPNDIELLTNAAIRLVPETGCSRALELADYVIPPADQGGWSAILDFL